MTGIDGAATLPPHGRPRPLDGPLPEVFVTFDVEYFVDWQVADGALRSSFGSAGEHRILFP